MAPPLLLVLLLLPALAAGHQHPSSFGSSALSEWRSAKASYYAADPEDAIGTHQSSSRLLHSLFIRIHGSVLPSRPFTSLIRSVHAASTHKDFSFGVPLARNFPQTARSVTGIVRPYSSWIASRFLVLPIGRSGVF